ncbi:MAG: hypothetical protein ACOY94_16760 [Bacillota bacterium]
MRQRLSLAVQGGTAHIVPIHRLHPLQVLVSELGAEAYPLFLRLGAVRNAEFQPVTARALLAEMEKFLPQIHSRRIPGVSFHDAQEREVGSIYGGEEERVLLSSDEALLSISARGIRVLLRQFPPPVGFRSHPGLENGWFECHFQSIRYDPDGATGLRTPAMGGSGAPVPLGRLPDLPPATRWDFARVAGAVEVPRMEFTETPAEEAYRDLLHAITAACNDSLRLRRVLRIGRDG